MIPKISRLQISETLEGEHFNGALVYAFDGKIKHVLLYPMGAIKESILKDFMTPLKDGTLIKVVGLSKISHEIKKYLDLIQWQNVKVVLREEEFSYKILTGDKILVEKNISPVIIEPIKSQSKIRVVIVDDSKTIRKLLKSILSGHPQIEVVGEFDLPSLALAQLFDLNPDVITLDIEMPEMNGVELLKKILLKKKIPCMMVTALGIGDSPLVLEALRIGAVDYLQKPSADDLGEMKSLMIDKIMIASKAKVDSGPKTTSVLKAKPTKFLSLNGIQVIGSSTGGTRALEEILIQLPQDIPPTLIVQHIPPIFSKAFADRLNSLCPFEVKEAQDGDDVKANRILIAPGGKQMRIRKAGVKYFVQLTDDPPVNRFKPSVDYMFLSAVDTIEVPMTAVILTGMGNDGAKGLLALKNKGAHTIAQDEASCVVFGMPREAIKLGAALEVTALSDIPSKLVEASKKFPL